MMWDEKLIKFFIFSRVFSSGLVQFATDMQKWSLKQQKQKIASSNGLIWNLKLQQFNAGKTVRSFDYFEPAFHGKPSFDNFRKHVFTRNKNIFTH